jgi:hypothetical protein
MVDCRRECRLRPDLRLVLVFFKSIETPNALLKSESEVEVKQREHMEEHAEVGQWRRVSDSLID